VWPHLPKLFLKDMIKKRSPSKAAKSKKQKAKKGAEKSTEVQLTQDKNSQQAAEKANPSQASAPPKENSFGSRTQAATGKVKETKQVAEEPKKEAKEQPKKKGFLARFIKKKEAEKPTEQAAVIPEKEGNFLIEVKERKKKGSLTTFFQTLNYLGMGKYRHLFIQSLSTMLNAGLPLLDSLRAFQEEVRSKPVKKMVEKILVAVENGSPMWRAMEQTCFFTPYEVALVHIGEDAGNLARNMEYLSVQQEKDHALKQKVKMAMIYPTIVLSMMFVIVMGLGLFVLPNLVQVLFSLNVELPLTTRIVISITHLFEAYGMQVVPLLIVLFIALGLLSKFTRFKAVTQWFMFRIPGIGRLAKEATIARFGVIMGGLLKAGVPLVESLESLVEVTQVYSYKVFYAHLLKRITVGDSFAKVFAATTHARKLLPVSVQQLVVTGERSGTLSNTLLKIADIYEKKAQETAEKLPIILEPMLLLFIGGLVGTIAFAIIVPIYSVVGNVGG